MPMITVDITGALPDVNPADPEEIRRKVASLAELARGEWIRLAQTNLSSSAPDYIAGIQPVAMQSSYALISLTGKFPNEIERGAPPRDLKPGLLMGPHARDTKSGGRLNIVPFRHSTPGTRARTVGTPMPITGSTKSGKPASLVYVAAKKLKASTQGPGGKTIWGSRTGDFGGMGTRTQLPMAGGRPGAYTWKSSPYASMYKVAKTYSKATQNQYVTFRAVSDNSDPASWWHPGIEARNFAHKVKRFIEEQIKRGF